MTTKSHGLNLQVKKKKGKKSYLIGLKSKYMLLTKAITQLIKGKIRRKALFYRRRERHQKLNWWIPEKLYLLISLGGERGTLCRENKTMRESGRIQRGSARFNQRKRALCPCRGLHQSCAGHPPPGHYDNRIFLRNVIIVKNILQI